MKLVQVLAKYFGSQSGCPLFVFLSLSFTLEHASLHPFICKYYSTIKFSLFFAGDVSNQMWKLPEKLNNFFFYLIYLWSLYHSRLSWSKIDNCGFSREHLMVFSRRNFTNIVLALIRPSKSFTLCSVHSIYLVSLLRCGEKWDGKNSKKFYWLELFQIFLIFAMHQFLQLSDHQST